MKRWAATSAIILPGNYDKPKQPERVQPSVALEPEKKKAATMPKVIQDEFSALPISRQRKWQLRQVRDGNCKRCGRKRTSYPQLCDPCQLYESLYRFL